MSGIWEKVVRLRKLIFLHLQHLPMPSRAWRPFFVKLGGVTILDYKNTFIGENVQFDTNYPEDIILESGVRITIGSIIITHFKNSDDGTYSRGQIHIGANTYLGCNTVVCQAVNIGKDVIVGAGSIVTKDIPDGEVWAGNPARFIKKRKLNNG